MKSSYRRPAVPALALPPRRLAQTRRKKLIVAGMGLAPRAMLDEGHSQASVATVILADSSWPLGALCALINSRLTGRLCRAMLGGLALGGGHLRFGKRELARLPVPDVPPSDPRVGKLDGLAGDDNKVEIDALVCQMFGVDEDVLNDSRRNGT